MIGNIDIYSTRRHDKIGKGPILGSVFVHTFIILLAWRASAMESEAPNFVVYEIQLVSPPAAELKKDPTPPPPEELIIETPQEVLPEPPEEKIHAMIEEDPAPDEDSKPEQITTSSYLESEDNRKSSASLDPDLDVEKSGEDLNVRMEGVRRDYPEYYNNIIRQMQRCFRWRGSDDLRATIYFVINRDGTVSDIDVLESSNNMPFDIEAMGAAECAGSRGRLGPLPENLPFDMIPVVFKIDPKNGRRNDF
tara:strand:- start:3485 stop:4234 length:750 start_codon:yes stop_codon:yes gene_type:complete